MTEIIKGFPKRINNFIEYSGYREAILFQEVKLYPTDSLQGFLLHKGNHTTPFRE
jgi:hypothetical protein